MHGARSGALIATAQERGSYRAEKAYSGVGHDGVSPSQSCRTSPQNRADKGGSSWRSPAALLPLQPQPVSLLLLSRTPRNVQQQAWTG